MRWRRNLQSVCHNTSRYSELLSCYLRCMSATEEEDYDVMYYIKAISYTIYIWYASNFLCPVVCFGCTIHSPFVHREKKGRLEVRGVPDIESSVNAIDRVHYIIILFLQSWPGAASTSTSLSICRQPGPANISPRQFSSTPYFSLFVHMRRPPVCTACNPKHGNCFATARMVPRN